VTNLGALVKRRRLVLGLTQEEICRRMGKRPAGGTVSRIEKGNRGGGSYLTARGLAGALDLPVEKIVSAMRRDNKHWPLPRDRAPGIHADRQAQGVGMAVTSRRVARGELRLGPCVHCGAIRPPGKMHGHHPDYRRPFEVISLCPPCHARLHTALRKKGLKKGAHIYVSEGDFRGGA